MRQTLCLLLVLLSALAATCHAAPPSALQDSRDALAKELLDLSGTKRQLESFPQMINAAFQPQGFSMVNPAVFELLQQASARQLSAERLYRTVLGEIKRAGTVDQLSAALGVVRHPTSLKFTAWEVEASKPEATADMQAFMSSLEKNPPDPARLKVLNAIDEAVGGTDLAVEMNMASFYAAAKAVRQAVPKAQQRSDEEIRKSGEAFRQQALRGFKEQTLAGMLFIYRNASTAEIGEYHALVTSPAARWLMKSLRAAHLLAMSQAMEDVGRDFGQELGKRFAASPQPSPSPAAK